MIEAERWLAMLRIFGKLLAVMALGGLLLAVGWLYFQKEAVTRFWACYRVSSATNYPQAKTEMTWFSAGPDRVARLHDLVSLWGSGNEEFDRNFVLYLQDPDCDDSLREAFSLELAWRPELLSRWAHCWCHVGRLEPEENFESIVRYIDTLAVAEPQREITWRDVLDLQAAFELAECRELALRLNPENYLSRHSEWVELGRPRAANLVRPQHFFPR